jgi:hypothetical protein
VLWASRTKLEHVRRLVAPVEMELFITQMGQHTPMHHIDQCHRAAALPCPAQTLLRRQ